MIKRVYDKEKIGYVEYNGNKVTARKKFYGRPQYYYLTLKNEETGEREQVRYENAIYSWRFDDDGRK